MISKERERIDRRLEAEMRARRERGELRRCQAQEIAQRQGYDWCELTEHDRDVFLQAARESNA
jgi:hypothetical protein